ncbi:MAG: hypothetical protein U9N42_05595, partial [Campylobacterota bacterium]|nr:hypothetical protein [Campylobacterota bacterium]
MPNLDYEIFEMFSEQFEVNQGYFEPNVLALESDETYESSVNELFRMFHNYKATTAYLGISVIHEVVTKTENVLSALRVQSAPANDAVIEWLLEVKDQFDIWQEEMRDGLTNFS